MKVARTRAQIVEVALDLFLERGYDATTMEQIAERAEIGNSTLYRYFPSKDLLILDPFARLLDFGRLLDARPADEPLGAALGAVLRGSFREDGMDPDRFSALRRVVDHAPIPRARLWDFAAQATRDLERALAARLQRPADDILVAMTARLFFSISEIVGESWWSDRSTRTWEQAVDAALEDLAAVDLVIPQ